MKNLAASVQARLAQRRAKTGEDFNVLLVRFSLERLLYRLSRSSHRDQFVLKGAMLFALWEPTLHRVTRDLDLLGFGEPSQERMAAVFRELCRAEVEGDGVDFDANSVLSEDIRAQEEYAGIRVKLKARIGKAIIPLRVDIGFGDALRIAPEEITFPVLLGMAAPRLRAYRPETVVAEKLETVVKLGMINTRFKDYFDLHLLSHKFPFEGLALSTAIAATFECRGTSFPEGLPVGLTPQFPTDAAKIREWESFYRKTVTKDTAPPFTHVVRQLAVFLEPPLAAASKGQPFNASWGSNRWTHG
ncbi:MAG TPA: nucleotidyl transferase AbiEii/AbiGii toxin family protein [Verrucomicrobiae bacterium]|jgi:predicted nucleotidyltransferase component of viral defense system|nr:nucleotidyl transferase AbiEii/AbiGii toxin family protein [Verrucomicrobiae bacterium]